MRIKPTREFVLVGITSVLLLVLGILIISFLGTLVGHFTIVTNDDLKTTSEPVKFNLEKARELAPRQ